MWESRCGDINIPVLAGVLMAAGILWGFAGNQLCLPGGLELKGKAEELLRNTGNRMGNEVVKTVLQRKITQADLDMQPEYFVGLRLALPLLGGAIFLIPAALGWLDFFWGILITSILYLGPGLWLNRRVKVRVEAIKKDIPDFCMLLGNALKGADLLTALEEVAKTMRGELAQEVNRALMYMATGDSRVEALNKMAFRCSIPELTALVNKIQQAVRYGSPLEPVVKHHAEKILVRSKQETQKIAGELTIKLLFPIIIFILMPLFLLLGFPIMWNLLSVFSD